VCSTPQKVNFGAQGYGANFTLSIFDREYKEGMSVEEAMGVIRKCIAELHTRFLINQPNFVIKLVDKDGIKVLS
jgi:20S proteasome alpha/beta subunit